MCVRTCAGTICGVCAGPLDDAVCHWPSVSPGGESGQQRDHCAACIPLPISSFGTQCIIVCVCVYCFHIWYVEHSPYMALYLLPIVYVYLLPYGVYTCFNIWCAPVSIYGVSPITSCQLACLHGTLTALLGIFGHSCGGCLAGVASRSKAFAQVSCCEQ